MVNKEITNKAFKRLNAIKENHSKVKAIKYSHLKVQNYLKPVRNYLSQGEIQTIFELRSRVTKVKLNFRGKFEHLECRECKIEEESQKHVYECDEIRKKSKLKVKIVEFEKVFGENVKLQGEISKYFMENMKIINKMEQIFKNV